MNFLKKNFLVMAMAMLVCLTDMIVAMLVCYCIRMCRSIMRMSDKMCMNVFMITNQCVRNYKYSTCYHKKQAKEVHNCKLLSCLLYTSDAADEL